MGVAATVADALELDDVEALLTGPLDDGGAVFGVDLVQPTRPTNPASASPLNPSPATLGATIRTRFTVAAGTEQAREANLPGL